MAAAIAGAIAGAILVLKDVIKEIIERGATAATSAALTATILQIAKLVAETKDPVATRRAVDLIIDAEIPGAAAAATAIKESDPLDFALGLSLHTIIDPFLKARLTRPIERTLKLALPYEEVSERMLVSALEFGATTPEALDGILARHGILTEDRTVVFDYAKKRRAVRLLEAEEKLEDARTRTRFFKSDFDLDLVEKELRDLEADATRLFESTITRSLDQEADRLEKEAREGEKILSDIEFGSKAVRQRAAGQLFQYLARHGA